MAERKIKPALVALIDAKLKNNGLATKALADKDARMLMTQAAISLVGTKEKTGHNDGEVVELIQSTIGGHGREPWCMAFVQSCIAYAELKCGVKSPVFASELCSAVWNGTPKVQRVKTIPSMGALMIFQDAGKISGHVEIVISSDGKTVQAVGGNTSGAVSPKAKVNTDGNGVFFTVRSAAGTKKRLVSGYLIPFTGSKVKA